MLSNCRLTKYGKISVKTVLEGEMLKYEVIIALFVKMYDVLNNE